MSLISEHDAAYPGPLSCSLGALLAIGGQGLQASGTVARAGGVFFTWSLSTPADTTQHNTTQHVMSCDQ